MENEAATTIEPIKVSINTKTFVCESCGGTMKYDIQAQRFSCSSCKAEKEIEALTDSIKEYDFTEYKKIESQVVAFNGMGTVQCQNCGREIAFDAEVIATTCPMCGSTHIADIKQSAGIAPEGVVPFKVDKQEAVQKFKVWVKSRWFAPNDFKEKCMAGMLNGMYIPFWTYDAEVIASYVGRGGKDHTRVNSKGERRTTTSWHNVSGIVGNNFDDIQICASGKIKDIDGIMPFNTIESTKPYSAAYLSGFYAELYTIKADLGFEQAKKYMEKNLRALAEGEIRTRYDRAELKSIIPKYSNVTYKHVLLPIWSSAFMYKGKTFNYFVNGETGAVDGKRPYSVPKIIAFILGVIIVIAAIIAII